MSLGFGEWYARESLIWLIAYALLAGFGFWVALAGRPMFGSGPAES